MRKEVTRLFRETGARHPSELTEGSVLTWAKGSHRPLANNTVRRRVSLARTFLAWARRRGLSTLDLEDEFRSLRRSFPATYGKKQSAYPARWLTRDEAFVSLTGACQDGTWQGHRDQIIIRLGLMGLRNADIRGLTWANVGPTYALSWMGKGHRERLVHPGPTFLDLLSRWRDQYESELGRPVAPGDPVICAMFAGRRNNDGTARGLYWGTPIGYGTTIADVVARRAAAAGLGHVAPHDLRRTAAAIMHRTRTPEGGKVFGLGEIQKVLGHASPDTTQHYLDQLDTGALDLAATVLD